MHIQQYRWGLEGTMMTAPIVLNHCLYKISIEDSKIELIQPKDDRDFKEFSRIILDELIQNARSKQYYFTDNNERVVSHIRSIARNEFLEGINDQKENWIIRTESIAKKLLDEETLAQQKISAMNKKIQKGSLLILHLEHEGSIKFVLLKIEIDSFFDEVDARIHNGLPLNKKRLQKSCLITLNQDLDVSGLLLSDSNQSIREYWWSGFLNSKEVINATVNTRIAYGAIDTLLKQTVKNESKADYLFMRNDVNSYFRNNDSFVHDELVEKLQRHKVENAELNKKLPEIIEKLKALPTVEKASFDTQFDLDPDVIKTKIKSTIILDENLELRIKGEVVNIEEIIKADSDAHGKYIKIYSDAGYEAFSKKGN
ncbi:nucleoid-associated protein [Yersinia enterocolitica]|uniref:nucleoid-associated protein n=1 Tax=Yersinia enterocolitica TaxID=630 RepID=UPI000681E45D|nr:nucleoid-associated protein [Yersinia enterocolitica]